MELPFDLATPLLRYQLLPNIHSSRMYNSQVLEANCHQQMHGSTNYGTLNDGILHSRKKEGTPTFMTVQMELESIMLSEISQAVKDKHHMNVPCKWNLINKTTKQA